MSSGVLYISPSPLAIDSEMSWILPDAVQKILRTTLTFIVEEVRTARRFIASLNPEIPVQQLEFLNVTSLPPSELLMKAKEGGSIVLLSEAGCPVVADPGKEVILEAHALGIRVKPLVGPSSILLGLMTSGLGGQHFRFHGYLPKDSSECRASLLDLEAEVYRDKITQIFIETPYRNTKLITEIISTCRPTTILCVASNLTSETETVLTLDCSEWKRRRSEIDTLFDDCPAIFLLGVR